MTANKVSQQSRMIVDKIISYSGITILLMVILSELGVNLTAILGAAGVLGIAIGVASQKSLGNMVSGLFLLSEKSFEIGDVLMIDDKVGIVQDVDLLALKIRTFDNKLIRIPNETLISTMVTNITKYPIRRVDLEFCCCLWIRSGKSGRNPAQSGPGQPAGAQRTGTAVPASDSR